MQFINLLMKFIYSCLLTLVLGNTWEDVLRKVTFVLFHLSFYIQGFKIKLLPIHTKHNKGIAENEDITKEIAVIKSIGSSNPYSFALHYVFSLL